MATSHLHKYNGTTRRIVIAFDIGITLSGASFCVLDPGVVPRACSVIRYPGQEHTPFSAKTPSIMYYDPSGTMRSAGAETNLSDTLEAAEEGEWIKVEWFTLRLRPKHLPSKLRDSHLPSLPRGTTITHVFANFLRYMYGCADLEENGLISFVIAHPNGWEDHESKLLKCCVLAGLVPDTFEGRSRISFVSVGEACLHYCIHGTPIETSEQGFVVAELGGGTLDFSTYRLINSRPLRVEEVGTPKCELEGSTLVTQRAFVYLKSKLKNSVYGEPGRLEQIAQAFDAQVKMTFRSKDQTCLVVFGSTIDKDIPNGIRAGKLKLTGGEVAAFFEPAIRVSANAIKECVRAFLPGIPTVYLVGDFSSSPYLISELGERLRPSGITLRFPEGEPSNAVAHGAILSSINQKLMSQTANSTSSASCSY